MLRLHEPGTWLTPDPIGMGTDSDRRKIASKLTRRVLSTTASITITYNLTCETGFST